MSAFVRESSSRKPFFNPGPNYNHQNKQTLASGLATLDAIAHFNSVQI